MPQGLLEHLGRIVASDTNLRILSGDSEQFARSDAVVDLLICAAKMVPELDRKSFERLAGTVFQLTNGELLKCNSPRGSSGDSSS